MAGMPDRRDPARQNTRIDGRRDTDHVLSPRDCAEDIAVSPDFIISEIKAQEIPALQIPRPGGRTLYRIAPAAWKAYKTRCGWAPGVRSAGAARAAGPS
jgi:hypothetical protein